MTTYSRRKFLKTAAPGAAGLTIVPNTVLGKVGDILFRAIN